MLILWEKNIRWRLSKGRRSGPNIINLFQVIDPIAPRYTGLEAASTVRVTVKGAVDGTSTVPRHPKNPEIGNKTVITGPSLLIAQEDVALLKEGENATFINWGNIKISKINR